MQVKRAFRRVMVKFQEIQSSLNHRYKHSTTRQPFLLQVSRSLLQIFNYLLCKFVQNRTQPMALMRFLSGYTWGVKTLYTALGSSKIVCRAE